MKQQKQVREQMEHFQEKIALLNDLRTKEMKKKYTARDYNLLKWVWIELAVYNFTLNKFKWILDVNVDHHEEEE